MNNSKTENRDFQRSESLFDERVRKMVFPVRIVTTFGHVENAEQLLEQKTLQVAIGEPPFTVLCNGSGGDEAGVVLDFGVELHGSPRILTYYITGEDPAQVQITTGESVSEAMSEIGYKNATNHHSVRDAVYTVPGLSDMTYNETGFRFLCIRLKSRDTKLLLKAAIGILIYRDLNYMGTFRCDREILNRIYDTAAYTCHLNMQGMVWDGIKRDRLVWVGDMHPEMLAIRTVFGRQKVLEDTIRFIRDITPLPGWMNGFPTYSLWWIIILYDWYFYTGDDAFLSENRAYLTGLISQITELIDEDGTDHLPGYFLDWPSHELPQEIDGSRALLAQALLRAEELAMILRDSEMKNKCAMGYERLSRKKGESHGSKQTAAMLARAGWMEIERASADILKDGASGFSTFMSYYLLTVACHNDMPAALQILENYYGAMLNYGATTFWEDFSLSWTENAVGIDCMVPEGKRDIHGDNGAFCYKGFRHSLCHGWASGPVAFLAEEVLGIKILEPGCKRIRISPNLGDLNWVEGTYPTPYGLVYVKAVRKKEFGIDLKIQAPDGVVVES
ncbi:MAG: alpha-L-rhamnosidase C-terminal domain-containing protein [Acutalibacteraceae bacterium]